MIDEAYPMESFFSAFWMIRRRIFSALRVKVEVCIRLIPYAFMVGDMGGFISLGERGGEGEEASLGESASFGEDGSPGHLEKENAEGDLVADGASSDKDELLECLVRVLVMVDDAVLKSDLAGEVAVEEVQDSC